MKRKRSWVGVIDCNNFFVSCERLFRPDLAKEPVVVLSSNDGCVVARSQEIKDIGVPMGVPYFKIKDMLEKAGATTFSSHFTLYRDLSRRVFSVVREEFPGMEQYSVDEAFFTTDEDPYLVARTLKQRVEREVGIPVSIGLAYTKTQAKYASKLAKKSAGVRVLNEDDWQALAPDISLSEIWGVGGKLELAYKRHGLQTVQDCVLADQAQIRNLFGVNGVRLQQELQGYSVLKLQSTATPQQSLMSSRSFHKDVFELSVLADAVAYHVRHVAADLRLSRQEGWQLRLFILPSRHGDFVLRGGSKELILPAPTNDTFILLQEAEKLLNDLYETGVPYKKVGVILGQLQPSGSGQGQLFEGLKDKGSGDLLAVIDTLNQRGGRELVVLGDRLRGKDWQAKSGSKSPAYTTRWSDIAKAKA